MITNTAGQLISGSLFGMGMAILFIQIAVSSKPFSCTSAVKENPRWFTILIPAIFLLASAVAKYVFS